MRWCISISRLKKRWIIVKRNISNTVLFSTIHYTSLNNLPFRIWWFRSFLTEWHLVTRFLSSVENHSVIIWMTPALQKINRWLLQSIVSLLLLLSIPSLLVLSLWCPFGHQPCGMAHSCIILRSCWLEVATSQPTPSYGGGDTSSMVHCSLSWACRRVQLLYSHLLFSRNRFS